MVTGQSVSLHPFDRPHLERTRAWVNDPELSRLLGRARPVSDDEHEAWFRSLQDSKTSVHFAIETNADRRHIGGRRNGRRRRDSGQQNPFEYSKRNTSRAPAGIDRRDHGGARRGVSGIRKVT